MKLTGRDAKSYFSNPDPKRAGLLIYGPDTMRVALKRQEIIAALVGPDGENEMRLTRMPAADIRKSPAAAIDAMKAQGFFPGPRVVFIEDATDTVADSLKKALEDWQDGDAQIIVVAGQLAARSKLRKLFETHKNVFAAAVYDDPPSRQDIEQDLQKAGLTQVDPPALNDLLALSRELDPGDFRQLIEKLALYKFEDGTPLSTDDVAALAPSSTEAHLDDILHVVAEARSGEVGPLMLKLQSQGTQPVALCIAATRHFRTLYRAASDPGGAASGIGKMRPPVFGPRRDRMVRQAQSWGVHRLAQALAVLTETDLELRSSTAAPTFAVMERSLIRLSMMGKR
ncbi:MAG: DNA polymerase III subunit delta [Halocynthiibacter sp.]